MRLRLLVPTLLLMALLLAAGVGDSGIAASPKLDRHKFMGVDEIKPGMIGVGKTVFRGTQIEEFHMEILGIARRARTGTDVILAKVLDGPVVERQSGIIAGMSGSPVYIDGRMIGAIALGWIFPKEPIAGITPIVEMLRALEPMDPGPAATEHPAVLDLDTPVHVDGETWRRLRISPRIPRTTPREPGVGTMVPMGGLVVASGFSDRALGQLRELLEPQGALVVGGMGGGESARAPTTLEPGGVMGVLGVGGDLDFAWLGTVSYVDGDRVLGFGHSMLTLGRVDLPLTSGMVHDIMPSYLSSFKLSDSGPVVGRLYQDQVWAVGGTLKETARTIPMTVSVTDRATGVTTTLNVTVARIKPLLANLVGATLITAIDQAMGRQAEGTANIRLRIEPEGYEPIDLANIVSDLQDVAIHVATFVVDPIQMLWENEFGGADFKRISAEIEIEDARRIALLERIYARESKIKAGESIQLGMVFRPYGKAPVTRHAEIAIPKDCPTGPVRLVVSGGAFAEQARRALGLAPFRPHNLGDLVEYYRRERRGDEIVIQAALPILGMNIANRKLPWLPSGVIDVLKSAKSSEILPEADELVAVKPADWVIVGLQRLVVSVEGKRPPVAPPPPPKRPTPPTGAPTPPGGSEEPGDEEAVGPSAVATPWAEMSAAWPAAAPFEVVVPRPARPNPSADNATKEPSTPTGSPGGPDAKPVGRTASAWKHSTLADFQPGECKDVALGSDGSLQLSQSLETVLELEQPIAWSVAAAGDHAYVGTGNKGEIYRRGPDGKPEVWFDSPELEIHCLLAAGDGALFAGTSPSGRVYRIAPDGKSELYFETGQDYVWALIADGEGRLFAATGVPGKVWRIDAQGKGEVIFDSLAAHVLSLARAQDGTLYAGTGSGAAVVYRLPPGGPVTPLYEASGRAVHALAIDDQGRTYVGTSPDGDIYRIDQTGGGEKLCDTPDRHVFALAVGKDGRLYAATGGTANGHVYRIDEEGTAEALLQPKQGQFLALALDSQGGIYAVGSNPAVLHRLSAGYASAGTFEAKPLDAKRPARWGRVVWSADVPDGASLAIQTRSGDTADPDDRWSSWSAPYAQSAGQQIASPPARFLQYRVKFVTDDPTQTPVLRQIELGYLPANQAPVVELVEPKPGARWSKKQTIKWKGKDDDKDTLVYGLQVSPDDGKTWSDIEKDVTKTDYQWDTTKQPDGRTVLKVVASDRRGNPADPLTDEATVRLWIDNTAPVCLIITSSIEIGDDDVLTASGVATDATSSITGVDFRIDGGEWKAAAAATGIFDAESVDFQVKSEALSPGKHRLSVRTFDSAGNVGTDDAKFEVKPSPEKEKDKEPGAAPEPTP